MSASTTTLENAFRTAVARKIEKDRRSCPQAGSAAQICLEHARKANGKSRTYVAAAVLLTTGIKES